jgi:hypothetical protein
MVVLGTTIHEFSFAIAERCPSKLVDGRTKSDHDEKGRAGRCDTDARALTINSH